MSPLRPTPRYIALTAAPPRETHELALRTKQGRRCIDHLLMRVQRSMHLVCVVAYAHDPQLAAEWETQLLDALDEAEGALSRQHEALRKCAEGREMTLQVVGEPVQRTAVIYTPHGRRYLDLIRRYDELVAEAIALRLNQVLTTPGASEERRTAHHSLLRIHRLLEHLRERVRELRAA